MYIMFMYLFMYLFACIRVYCYYVESCEHDRAVMSCDELWRADRPGASESW